MSIMAITLFLAKFSNLIKREIKMAENMCVCVWGFYYLLFYYVIIIIIIIIDFLNFREISSDFSNGFKHVPRGIF
jgi:hypothetical protein